MLRELPSLSLNLTNDTPMNHPPSESDTWWLRAWPGGWAKSDLSWVPFLIWGNQSWHYPHPKADFQHMPVSNEAAVLWAKALVGVIDFCISLDSLKYHSMRGKRGWPFSSPQTVNSLTNPYSRLIMVSNVNINVFLIWYHLHLHPRVPSWVWSTVESHLLTFPLHRARSHPPRNLWHTSPIPSIHHPHSSSSPAHPLKSSPHSSYISTLIQIRNLAWPTMRMIGIWCICPNLVRLSFNFMPSLYYLCSFDNSAIFPVVQYAQYHTRSMYIFTCT